jgi:hypothetical protein
VVIEPEVGVDGKCPDDVLDQGHGGAQPLVVARLPGLAGDRWRRCLPM